MDRPVLKFDGKQYDFWQSLEIRYSVDDLCAALAFSATLGGSGSGLAINQNTTFTLWYRGHLLATARSDVRRRSVAADSHDIQIEARSLGRELVDAQYSVVYNELPLNAIVNRLCTLFKVPVNALGKSPIIPQFAMQGEQPANALLNAARTANRLLYATADGGIIMTEPDNTAAIAAIVYGKDIKRYEVVQEDRLRFSEYQVRSFDYFGDAKTNGKAKDAGVTFFRPMHIVGERAGQSAGACTRRAEFERNRRLARSYRLEIELAGWTHAGGVWQVNKQVRVVIPQEGIDDVLLIGDCALSLSDSGFITRLSLMPRAAFLGETPAKIKRAGNI